MLSKTIFDAAREEGYAIGIAEVKAEFKAEIAKTVEDAVKTASHNIIKKVVSKTRFRDAAISAILNVSIGLVKTIREEVKVEKAAAAALKKATKPKGKKT